MLAPLTNTQSHADGTLSDDEIRWLTTRTGFGLSMSAAAFVTPSGRSWVGQLGVSEDAHLPGLRRMADGIRATGAVSAVQLQHGGARADASLTGERIAPVADDATGARAVTTTEIHALVQDFADAARRVEQAGFDGVQLHGAHGYLICQFLSRSNTRTDGYGGDLADRTRILREMIDAVRAATSPSFQVGVRLSVERFGIDLEDMVTLAADLLQDERLDHVEASLWDWRKRPEGAPEDAPDLLSHFVGLPRDGVALGIAGHVRSGADAQTVLDAGADFATIGRAAIADHAFAARTLADSTYDGVPFPVTAQHLREQHLGEAFVDYFSRGWPDYIAD